MAVITFTLQTWLLILLMMVSTPCAARAMEDRSLNDSLEETDILVCG